MNITIRQPCEWLRLHYGLGFPRLFQLLLTTTTRSSPFSTKPSSLVSLNPDHTQSVYSICSLLTRLPPQPFNIHHLLKDFQGNLSSTLVFHVLKNYPQLGRAKTLEFFSWAGFQMGFQFDDSVIEYMVGFLVRRKLFDDTRCFFLTLKSHNRPISCRAFATCIRFLGREGMVSEALSLFEEMGPRFGCQPNNFVCNGMLNVLCRGDSSEQSINLALQILPRIRLPYTYAYSNLVIGLCKFDKLDKALEVFGEMCKAGSVPTRSAADLLIGKLCSLSSKDGSIKTVRVRKTDRPFTILVPSISDRESGAVIKPAIEAFWTVHDLGLLPSSFVMVQLLTELCRLGQMDEAVEVFKVIEGEKASCLEESYTVMLKAMCSRGCAKEAGHLLRRMLLLRMKPAVSMYNSVISVLCKNGNLDDADRVYKIMDKNRCELDSWTYSPLIHGHVKAGNWEASYELLMEMLGLRLSPHFRTYDMVLKLLSRTGKTDLCLKLETRFESRVLQKLCNSSRLKDAYDKLESMLDRGLYPPRYVTDAFEITFQKTGGNRKLAQDLLERVDKAQSKEKKIDLSNHGLGLTAVTGV